MGILVGAQLAPRRCSLVRRIASAASLATLLAGCQGSFTILTYNVHGLPDFVTGDDTEARMRGISPHLDDYDVAAVQENFFYSVALGSEVQGRIPYHFTDLKPGTVAPSGLSVYSRYPAEVSQGGWWEACNGYLDYASDCLASKGFFFLRLQVPATAISFDLYDLHMDAGNAPEDDAARTAQAQQLLNAIETFSEGRPVMVIGDFNLSIDDPEDVPVLDALKAGAGLEDACTAAACPEPDHIDQLLFRDGGTADLAVTSWQHLEFTDGNGVPLSDHDPIVFGLAYQL